MERLSVAVEASGTGLTDVYGVGPVVAGLLIGYTGDVTRFPTRHHYAAYNGTAPIEMSSGGRKRHRNNPAQPGCSTAPKTPLDKQTGIDLLGCSEWAFSLGSVVLVRLPGSR